ncbi:hypothetical protein WN944_026124 [Citrus x changshan-huyou]|uniref:Cyclopropane-fatty-acyl-phospholipid synthase n=1 Tax=Citrus x changshan-huyou TaxID=2935761 RepID=A0AAP0QCZ0_9ROSI
MHCRYIQELENNPDINRNETLGQFLKLRGYSELFQKSYLIPLCDSVWSCPSERAMSFSAFSVLSFCRSHHLLELFGHPQWLTFRNRSHSYVNKVTGQLQSWGCQIRTSCEVYSVYPADEGCTVVSSDGSQENYSCCVMAVHAPDALRILGNQATLDETRILGAFRYVYSDIFLHRDKNFMPQNTAAWSAWNFLGSTDGKICLTYWLNVLQNNGETGVPFLATLNPDHTPENTLLKWSTSNQAPSVAASKASLEVDLIQGKRGIWFCGAYQGYGFQEDGLKAGMITAHGVLGKNCAVLSKPKHMVPSLLEKGARLFVAGFFRRYISTGCLILLEEGGTIFTFEGALRNSPLKTVLRIHNPQFYWKVMTEADLGLADSYINGDFSFVDKDEGLLNLFLILIANQDLNSSASKLKQKRGWWSPMFFTASIASAKCFFRHNSRKNTLTQARRNVSRHYDLARVSKGQEVLDIGCGWGTLAIEIVKQTGCKYTGITLSKEQLKYAQIKVREAGLQDHIRFYLCDYRQLPKANKYDRIISCEMIEHVGHDYMEEFFDCCESLLAKHGLLVLQFTSAPDQSYDEYRLSPGFLNEYIFPGGCVPSLSRVTAAMTSSSRLCEILALGFNEKFIRTWEYYFDYCAASFKSRIIGNYQIVFSRPGNVAAFSNPYEGLPSAYQY